MYLFSVAFRVEGDNKITNQKLQKEDDIVEENVG
jgi:hypothetical protein